MTILGTDAIRAALRDGAIVCDSPVRVEGAHLDVTVGEWYWVHGSERKGPVLLADEDPENWFSLRRFGDVVIIPPRGFVLAHTAEYIGTAPGSGLLPTLHTRSTLARWGLGCHPSAGWGDEGYISRWTLEIVNPLPVAVALPVGARVGCIAFHRVEGAGAPYAPGTRYNATPSEWTPAAMLPRKGNW